jgi:hypothetical protein
MDKKAEEINSLFLDKGVGKYILPNYMKNDIISNLNKKIQDEMDDMRRRAKKDEIDMKYLHHPKFNGLEMRNVNETNRQIGILMYKKIIFPKNNEMTNIENKIGVKSPLYEMFGINIPLKVLKWEEADSDNNTFNNSKKPKKKDKKSRNNKRYEDNSSQISKENKENPEENADQDDEEESLLDPVRPMLNTNLLETTIDAPKKLFFSKVIKVKE